MPMQPNPRAETSRSLLPSLRLCIVSSCMRYTQRWLCPEVRKHNREFTRVGRFSRPRALRRLIVHSIRMSDLQADAFPAVSRAK